MRDCNIIINNDGTVTVSKVNEYIEERGATRLVISLSDELKNDSISYYTLCFKPGAALKNPPNVKVTSDMITADSTLGKVENGTITYSLPSELTRFGSLDVQVQAHITGDDDSLLSLIKSPVFRLSFEPSVTGEEDIVIRDSNGFIDLIHTALAQLNMTVEEADALCDKISEAYENGELNGPVIMPNVSEDGTLSWSNDAGIENPRPVNIKGPKGDKGDKGDTATINGCSAVTLEAGANLKIIQQGETLTLSVESVPVYHTLPEKEKDGSICLYSPSNTLSAEHSGKRICFDWEKFNSALNENSYFDLQLNSGSVSAGIISVSIVFTDDLSELWRGLSLVKGNEEWFVNFYNGEFDPSSSYYRINSKYQNLTEPLEYFDLPEFDTVYIEQGDINGELFFTLYKPMIYFGEWTELAGSGHTHQNKELLDKITQDMIDNFGSADETGGWIGRYEYEEQHSELYSEITKVGLLADAALKLRTESSETTVSLDPSRYYNFGEVESLTLDFKVDENLAVYRNEYLFTFTSGETPTVLTLPASVQWVNELTVEANKRYEVSIVDNIGLWCAVEVSG